MRLNISKFCVIQSPSFRLPFFTIDISRFPTGSSRNSRVKKLTAFLVLFPVSLFLLADRGEATGTGGTSFPTISANSTSAQTLSSGTGTVNSGITLNVGSGGNSPSGNGTPAITVTGNSSIVNNGTIEEWIPPPLPCKTVAPST